MKPSGSLETLPEPLLDRITSGIIASCPSLTLTLLSELGSSVHQSTIRALFDTLVLQDDARIITPTRKEFHCPILSVLLNPVKYGRLVRNLEIIDPVHFDTLQNPAPLLEMETNGRSSPGELLPLSSFNLETILQALPQLGSFAWRSTTCPPDGVCETLAKHNPRLSNFTYLPASSLLPSSRSGPLRWDGLSLPLLSKLSLTTLHLSRLSHVGAKSLANLLSLLDEESLLEDVSIDTNWLNDHICQLLGHVSRKAKHLRFASDGTRLTDSCITTLISLCESLEEFSLGDIQGRLSKSVWEKINDFPPSLKRFSISISESTLQHSWTIDHLSSLHALPLSTLTHLSITRVSNPFQAQIHQVASLKPVPEDFARVLQVAKSLCYLVCDWWSWAPEQLKTPMESCPNLRFLRVAFDGSFSKLLSTTLPMSSAVSLESFAVFIPPEHCPALPPSPATTHHAVSRSPSASPLQLTRRLSVSVNSTSEPIGEEKFSTSRSAATLSETGIPLREIRKFVRRSFALREIVWYGRTGIQGLWNVSRPLVTSQSSANLTVEYIPCAALPEDVYERVRQEEDAMKSRWSPHSVEREGSVWTGPNADLYNSLRAAEKDNEDRLAKEEKAIRMASRKGGLSGLGIEMSKQSLKSSTTGISPGGKEPQIPSPVSPVEIKTLILPRKSPPRERRHTSASTNGEATRSSSASPQTRYKNLPDIGNGTAKSSSSHESGRGRTFSKRGTYGASEGRPRAEANGGGVRRSSQAGESTNSRGGSSWGGRSTRGGRPRRSEP